MGSGQSKGTTGQTEQPAPTATPAATPPPAPPPCDRQRSETDRAALEVLFNVTNGESWDDSGIWLGPTPISQWPGVSTDDGGCVTELRLGGMHGELPAELGNLANLRVLYLNGGSIENRWRGGSKYHGISGEIPPELSNLTNLQHLHLEVYSESRGLSGCIPGSPPPSLNEADWQSASYFCGQ